MAKIKSKSEKSLELTGNENIGIKANTTPIDRDSSTKTENISSNAPITEEFKEQIKAVFKTEFDESVISFKNEITKEGQEIKKDFLIFFGLFTSFVSFLAIEVQVFKNRDNILELIGISAIFLSFIMFFALVMNSIVKDKSDWKDFAKPIYLLNLIFLILGILSLYIGGNITSNNRIEKLETKIKKDSISQTIRNREIESLLNRNDSISMSINATTNNKEKATSKTTFKIKNKLTK